MHCSSVVRMPSQYLRGLDTYIPQIRLYYGQKSVSLETEHKNEIESHNLKMNELVSNELETKCNIMNMNSVAL